VSYVKLIESELEKFHVETPSARINYLAQYCEELDRWNKKINLTGLSGEAMVRRLVAEPVWIGNELQLQGKLVDIGSGNGSPAIPLDIVCPIRACHLVESRTKRAAFLRHVVQTLKLDLVVVHRARFQDLAATFKADWITLQAVALTGELVDSIRRFAKGTTCIVWISSQSVETVLPPFRTLTVPVTGTRVFLFRLDLS
jgi:16S rRNA (guanine527-N7)-methyltransferase